MSLVTFWDVWALVYLVLTSLLSMLLRPANPSMGFRSANTTSPASSPAALGDSESAADTVLD